MQYSLSLPKYSNSSSDLTPLASFLDARAYEKIAGWNLTKDLNPIYLNIVASYASQDEDYAAQIARIEANYAAQIEAATDDAAKAALEERRDNDKIGTLSQDVKDAAKATYVSGRVNALDSSRFTEFFSRLNYKLHSEADFDLEETTNETGDWIKLSWIFKDSDASSEA